MLYALMKLSAFDISLLYAMLVKILPADVRPSYLSLPSYTAKTLWSEGKMIIWLLEAEYTIMIQATNEIFKDKVIYNMYKTCWQALFSPKIQSCRQRNGRRYNSIGNVSQTTKSSNFVHTLI